MKEDKYYLPEDWKNIYPIDKNKVKMQVGYKALKEPDWLDILEEYVIQGNWLYHKALEELTPTLGRKRAKESARFFKTFNSQITMDVMFNWRSFAHFQQLRNSEHAQVEVRELAQQMLDIVKNLEGNPFEHTINAFKL